MESINWTGERLITSVQTINTIEHLHRYAIAIEYCKNKIVLDIACGEGYGTNLIGHVARSVVGMDISEETILHASKKYKSESISFQIAQAHNLPLEDSSVDVVVSFETIEHHDFHEEMMKEVKRVLKPDGILILSSPDKTNYSDVRGYNNPFHIKELTRLELQELVGRYFSHTEYIAQRAGYFSVALSEKRVTRMNSYKGDYHSIECVQPWGAMYWIVLASEVKIPDIEFNALFSGDNVIEEYKKGAREKVLESKTYRIGYLFLWPLRILKKLLKGHA